MPGDPLFYLVGWTTTLLVGIGKGAFGGGLAILGVPLPALVADPRQAAIMVALPVAAMDLFAIGSFGAWAALALLPAAPIGVWIGRWLHERLDQKRLFFACYPLLAVAALKLTSDAALALLR